ncbi:MAG: hypothetical protein KF744_11020 [Taibaiella sp.]|nr:hypothetical protein [Taibaiella sp.]
MLGIEFTATVVLAGIGMYKLVRSFEVGPGGALIGALSFSACGFFVSNAEHLTWIVSAGWLVWALWSYRMMLETKLYGYAVLTAIFLWMIFTGGYPAFLFIVAYLFFFSSVAYAAPERWRHMLTLVKANLVIVLCFLALSAQSVFYFVQSSQYISRGAGVTLAKANAGAFTPQCLISFFLPFLTVGDASIWQTDISMANSYIGIVVLLFLLIAVFTLRDRRYIKLPIVAAFFLLVSFGAALPLRGWLFRFVPLMNLFRMPSLFRLYSIIGFIVLACVSLQAFLTEREKYRRHFVIVLLLLLVGFGSLLVFEIAKHGIHYHSFRYFQDPVGYVKSARFSDRAILQGTLQLLVLTVLLSLALYKRGHYLTYSSILALVVVDLLAATELNTFATITNGDMRTAIEAKIEAQPRGFPLPDLSVPLLSNRDANNDALSPLWGNLGVFKKVVSPDGYNPFMLKSCDSLSESIIRDSVWSNPVAYFGYKLAKLENGAPIGKHTVAVDDLNYQKLNGRLSSSAAGDSVWATKFEPGDVHLSTRTSGTSILVLQQTDYPGWHVRIDGEHVDHFKSSYANISVLLPAGRHEIEYEFKPRHFMVLATISFSSLIALLAGLVMFRRRLFHQAVQQQ